MSCFFVKFQIRFLNILCPAEHWTIFYCFFLYLGSICSMYVLCASNPAVAAKSNKPLLLFIINIQ